MYLAMTIQIKRIPEKDTELVLCLYNSYVLFFEELSYSRWCQITPGILCCVFMELAEDEAISE
jgi:hypothetical protein